MFRDARGIENHSTLTADLCIVGAGAAGITLALRLKDAGFSTVLLEAGGTEYEEDIQAVYAGEVQGNLMDDRYLTASRLRYFGGTTNHWGGHSVVINPHVFDAREGVLTREWPISADVLRPYYREAANLLGVRKPVEKRWAPRPRAGMLPMERYPVGAEEKRLGIFYRDEIRRSKTQVLLHASVTAINPDAGGRQIRDLIVETLAGNRFSVQARAFVLATGAIENARLLLLPARTHPAGIGNGSGWVGRNFSEHLFVRGKIIETATPWQRTAEAFQAFAPDLLSRFGIPEVAVLRHSPRDDNGVANPVDSVLSEMAGMADRSTQAKLARVTYYLELSPDPDNRVMLSEERDPFGHPRSKLQFNVTSATRENYARALRLFVKTAGEYGAGRVHLPEQPRFIWANHHIGTTRMSNDPSQGVVDGNGKVHGISNLFVSGSSIFANGGGSGNPTFPLIALAARLADHLEQAFARRLFD